MVARATGAQRPSVFYGIRCGFSSSKSGLDEGYRSSLPGATESSRCVLPPLPPLGKSRAVPSSSYLTRSRRSAPFPSSLLTTIRTGPVASGAGTRDYPNR